MTSEAELRLSFEVACPQDHAFEVWTSRIGMWWPADHTADGEDGVDVVLEPGVGGRLFQRDPAGREVDWGEVTVWEPPRRLGYLWHLHRDRSDATDVLVQFLPTTKGTTVVEIAHSGWERLGAEADVWRGRNEAGWSGLVPHYAAAAGGLVTGVSH